MLARDRIPLRQSRTAPAGPSQLREAAHAFVTICRAALRPLAW
jgi:hypothetical protein